MITVHIPMGETVDDETGVIYHSDRDWEIVMEHSLMSIQKWEAKWHVAFLNQRTRTFEQIIDYLRCMTLTPIVPDEAYYCIPADELKRVMAYVEDPMTATHIDDPPAKNKGFGRKVKQDVPTAELIYYWMITAGIPYECRKWHINQLLTLIRVINAKNSKDANKPKRKRSDILEDYRSINEANKARFNTKG